MTQGIFGEVLIPPLALGEAGDAPSGVPSRTKPKVLAVEPPVVVDANLFTNQSKLQKFPSNIKHNE